MHRARTKPRSLIRSLSRNYLILSLVPFISFFICTLIGAYLAQRHIGDLIEGSLGQLAVEIEAQTVTDGKRLIQKRAREVAQRIDLVLGAHPGTGVAQLLRDPVVSNIAMQQVGLTGYTCLYEAGTGVMLIHPNAQLIGKSLSSLADKLPSFWMIFEPSLAGVEVSGYYDWLEEDGRVAQKYMTMTPVATKVEGRTLMVAATTYMDEFLAPVHFSRESARQIIERYREYVSSQHLLIALVMASIMGATLFVVFWLSRRAAARFAQPIRQLAEAASEFGREVGADGTPLSILERSDEIGDLARAFTRMRSQISDQFKQIKSGFDKLWETQQALSESEAHYRSLFDNVPIGLCRAEVGGRIIDANPALVEMFGYPDKKAFLSQPAAELYVRPQDRELFKEMVSGEASGNSCQFQMRRRDGSPFWVEIQAAAVRDEEGRLRYYESSSKDITERKKAEEELKLARFCIDNAAVGIFHTADDASILAVNEHVCRSLGYTRQELLGMTVLDIDPSFASSEEWERSRCELARQGVRVTQTSLRRKDGGRLPAEITTNHFQRDGRGFAYSFVMDISGRLAAEREKGKLLSQLRQAQKMEAIGTLAGGIAHDFNNILGAILGNANMLELSETLARDDAPYVQQILFATERARQLVKQILTFSRRGEQQRLPVNLKPLVQETFDFLKSTLPTSIEVRRGDTADAGAVWADPTQMQQVLMNLCTNAAHAMEDQEAGVLEIRLEKTTLTAEQAHCEQDVEPGEFVKLTVADTGPGIEPYVLERMFEPYFTTKAHGKGTGLGLSVVHGIVNAHGGFIKVCSEPGKGTRFEVFLPLASEVRKPVAAVEGRSLPRGSETVLLVDDEKMLVEMTRQMLVRLGYRVDARTSPLEAIEAFRANPAGYDAVITDMTMPQMNGVSLSKKLLEIRGDLPILLCTGFSDQANEERARAAGVRKFVLKPLAMSDFASTLRGMLDANGGKVAAG